MGAPVAMGTSFVIGRLELSAPSPLSGEGGVVGLSSSITNGQWLNQSCLSNKACTKLPEAQGWESWTGEHRGGGGGGPDKAQKFPPPTPYSPGALLPCPLHSFHLAAPELNPCIINWQPSN